MNEDTGTLALEALTDFLDAVEAGIESARQTIKTAKHLDEENLNFSGLFWEKKPGAKGEFEQTSERANGNSPLWQQLKAKLKEHQGFCQHQGFKYWFDNRDECVVDRRKTA
jgi:hypothetical protein